MYLYIIILLASAVIPVSLSFDKKVHFFSHWRYVLPAIFMIAAVFIVIDIIFTSKGVWGFNPQYNMGIVIAGLPLEEYLFFILVPYACLFIHYVFLHYSGGYSLPDRSVRIISAFLIFIMALVSMFFSDKIYTMFYSLFTAGMIMLLLFEKTRILNRYFITYLIMLVPFIMVNSILTGTFLSEEVVWYNGDEIIGVRVLTIPVEDFLYLFSLIAMILLTDNKLRSAGWKKLTSK